MSRDHCISLHIALVQSQSSNNSLHTCHQVAIPFTSVAKIEKKNTALVFPNALQITTLPAASGASGGALSPPPAAAAAADTAEPSPAGAEYFFSSFVGDR